MPKGVRVHATSTSPQLHPQPHTNATGGPEQEGLARGHLPVGQRACPRLRFGRFFFVGSRRWKACLSTCARHQQGLHILPYPIQAMEGLPERPSADLLCCTPHFCRTCCSPGPSSGCGSQACHAPQRLCPSLQMLQLQHLQIQSSGVGISLAAGRQDRMEGVRGRPTPTGLLNLPERQCSQVLPLRGQQGRRLWRPC